MAKVKLTVGSIENTTDRGSLPVHSREPQRIRSRVCRNLFGPVDHDELKQEIESKLREISERDQKRWNFNFLSGTPLDGEFEWEEASETSPSFYHESVQVGKKRAALRHVKQYLEVTQRENSAQNEEKAVPSNKYSEIPSCGKVRRKTTRFTSTRITGTVDAFFTNKRHWRVPRLLSAFLFAIKLGPNRVELCDLCLD